MSAIDPLTAFPSRKDPAFKTRVETFFDSEISTMVDQMNAAIAAINTNDLRGTSSTAFTPNTLGSKAFTTESGKSWVPGMWLTGGYTLDGREGWAGVVETYSGTTLNVDIKWVSDTATSRSSWQISVSPPVTDLLKDAELILHSGNGYGSTNTKFRRYSTIYKNTLGSLITYNDDASLGGSITINAAGFYYIEREEGALVSAFGVSRNYSTGTTNFPAGLTFDQRLVKGFGGSTARLSGVRWLEVGDVLRAHDGGTLSTDTSDTCNFRLQRLK